LIKDIAQGSPSSWGAAPKPNSWQIGQQLAIPYRRNILHQHFSRIGVGVAQEPAGWYTFVLVFAGD